MDNLKLAAPLAAGIGATAGVVQTLAPTWVPVEDAVVLALLTLIPLLVTLAQAEIRARLVALESRGRRATDAAPPAIVPVSPVVVHTETPIPTPAEQPTPVTPAPITTEQLIAELLTRLNAGSVNK